MRRVKIFKRIGYLFFLLSPPAFSLILFFIIVLDKKLRYSSEPALYFPGIIIATSLFFILAVIICKKIAPPLSKPFSLRLCRWYREISLWVVLLILIFFILLYLFTTRGGRLGSDGRFYYSYLHSVYFDGDLNFSNEYNYFGLFRYPYIRSKTATGLRHNVFSIGPAMMWSPFYLLAHLSVLTYNLLGGSIEANGFSYPYYTAITLGNLIYGFLGLLLLYSTLKKYFSSSLSFLTAIAVLFGSFLIWYMVYEPSMSHSVSFFAVSLFLFLWLREREKRSYKDWLLLGISAGLMVAVRWQNAVFLLLPALDSLLMGISWLRKRDYLALRNLILYLIVFLLPVLLFFIPQMIVWKSLYGSFLTIPQQSKVLWHRPMIWETLFSSRHGLLSWTPLIYFSLIGLVLFFMKDKKLLIYLSTIFVVMVYLNSIIQDWWAGWAFGSRRFASCLPIFALGFASLLDLLVRKPKILIGGFIGILACWNLLFMMQFKRGEIPSDNLISFKDVAHRQLDTVLTKIGYPFSFPANFVFALKYGVSPSKYDLLIGRSFYQPSIDVGAVDDEIYIGRGWSYPQIKKKIISFRWSNSWESTLLIPLQQKRNYQLNIRMRPYWVNNYPRQRVEIWVNNKFLSRITLKQGYSLYSIYASSRYWKRRINEIKFRYSYIISPAEADGSKDSRRLAIAVDYVKFKAIK